MILAGWKSTEERQPVQASTDSEKHAGEIALMSNAKHSVLKTQDASSFIATLVVIASF